jgi:hypothetical protein
MGKYVRSIRVEDASGAQFQMHEFLIREPVFGYVRKRRRFELDTGELATRVCERTFAIAASGETLRRVGR